MLGFVSEVFQPLFLFKIWIPLRNIARKRCLAHYQETGQWDPLVGWLQLLNADTREELPLQIDESTLDEAAFCIEVYASLLPSSSQTERVHGVRRSIYFSVIGYIFYHEKQRAGTSPCGGIHMAGWII